jgi:hypothetical protein
MLFETFPALLWVIDSKRGRDKAAVNLSDNEIQQRQTETNEGGLL